MLFLTIDVHTFTPRSASAARTSPAPTPATSNETIPHRTSPTSLTVTPGVSARRRRSVSASARVRAHAASTPTARQYSAATPSPTFAAKATSYCSNRRAPGWASKRSALVHLAPWRSICAGAARVVSRNALDAKRNPIPLGPRRYLRPVPTKKSHRIFRTSTGIWPTLWHASRRYAAPCFFATAPMRSAGLTNPPEVGTCVAETSAFAPGGTRDERIRSRASTSSWPEASLGTVSMTMPWRSAAWR